MTYVIKNKSKNCIWIKSSYTIPENEDPDAYSLVYTFPWDIQDLKAYLRPWIVPREEYYQIEVIDAIEEIKDLKEPPKTELKRIYQIPEKVSKFEDGIRELIKFGLLHDIEFPKGDYSWIIYKDDLISYLYSLWPEKYVDLGLEYLELDREERGLIQKLYAFNTRPQQEKFLETEGPRILPEFIISSLRATQKLLGENMKEIKPEFVNNNCIWKPEGPSEEEIKDRILKDFPIGSYWERTEAREKLDKIEMDLGLPEKIRITDLEKYFELPGVKNKKFKILRRK